MSEDDDKMGSNKFEEVPPPRDVRIEADTRSMYESLRTDKASPYQDAQLIQIFLNAAAVGSEQGLRQELTGETRALFNISSLSDRQRTHIRSIAWKDTHDQEIYYNHKRAFRIATEFANGGVRYLHQNHLGIGDNTTEVSTGIIQRWNEFERALEDRGLLTQEE
jgi:hypothetical protein